MTHNIVLIGPMGAGKTTIGRQLATRLGYEFLDTDHIIESRSGADIPWIFDIEGEQGFRQRETKVLAEVVERDKVVIATGGGVVTQTENRKLLRRSGSVFYLTASLEHLIERTYKDKKRPLLQVADPRAKIRELLTQRDPLYREIADEVIVTDKSSTKDVVSSIVKRI